jgi:hypothetical protein
VLGRGRTNRQETSVAARSCGGRGLLLALDAQLRGTGYKTGTQLARHPRAPSPVLYASCRPVQIIALETHRSGRWSAWPLELVQSPGRASNPPERGRPIRRLNRSQFAAGNHTVDVSHPHPPYHLTMPVVIDACIGRHRRE